MHHINIKHYLFMLNISMIILFLFEPKRYTHELLPAIFFQLSNSWPYLIFYLATLIFCSASPLFDQVQLWDIDKKTDANGLSKSFWAFVIFNFKYRFIYFYLIFHLIYKHELFQTSLWIFSFSKFNVFKNFSIFHIKL